MIPFLQSLCSVDFRVMCPNGGDLEVCLQPSLQTRCNRAFANA